MQVEKRTSPGGGAKDMGERGYLICQWVVKSRWWESARQEEVMDTTSAAAQRRNKGYKQIQEDLVTGKGKGSF